MTPGDAAAASASIRLARLALDLDELTARLEDVYLTDGAALLLSAPALHLTIGFNRLQQLLYEATETLDDRPRLQRLAERTP